MIVYPAIDVLEGMVVRLTRGDSSQARVYSKDPVATAAGWVLRGASWIHLVSLDAAFGRAEAPLELIRAAASTGAKVQYGGGVRTERAACLAVEAGASRIVLGTAAVADPCLATALVKELGSGMVAVALDAREGALAVSGWRETTAQTAVSLGGRLADCGVRHVIYTEVERDGCMSGPPTAAAAFLAESTGLEVIASGGVSSLEDIAGLARTGRIAGVVVGRALYEGALDLADALGEPGTGGSAVC
ncbi:1-(5-phosphoribosyl)-5-((5-phosphoribosylamino)methylideneamino)imidazole-4-carboxamide isomerase [Candidatus Fermentibacteria bacterium]|nr:1-(5-phosphoribosyl)-5-((5-phosphoribosylamino)methylideneamino)imidazole-4-carboxamide isomerase [Candidatus Fermentibacteria bacterium]